MSISALDSGAGPSSAGDAIASLEKTTAAEENMNSVVRPRISILSDLSERRNADPYVLSKKLRNTFRETKKAEKRAREEEDSVRNKFGLSTELKLVKEDDVREEAREEWQRARREYMLEEDVRQKTFRSQHGSLGLNSQPKAKPSRVGGSSSSSPSAKSALAASLLRNSLKKSDPFTVGLSASLDRVTRAQHS
jgi:coiled-coil domain-containing protein 130